jgi:hypothetical protein
MNRAQAVNQLINGRKITHDSFGQDAFLIMKGNNIFDESGEQLSTKQFMIIIFDLPNSGFSIWEKKKTEYITIEKVINELALSNFPVSNKNWSKNKIIYLDDDSNSIVDNEGNSYSSQEILQLFVDYPNGWYLY